MVSGLIGLSARHEPAMKPLAAELQQRIAALGRAHEFARPHSEHSRPMLGASTLKGLLAEIFSPYPAFGDGRMTIEGDDVPVDDRGATPIALVFHELATNAAKYGALSTPDGRIGVAISVEGESVLIGWVEAGGPPIASEPERTGFGTRLAEMSIAQQLGGKITRVWNPAGLEVRIDLLIKRLHREGGA